MRAVRVDIYIFFIRRRKVEVRVIRVKIWYAETVLRDYWCISMKTIFWTAGIGLPLLLCWCSCTNEAQKDFESNELHKTFVRELRCTASVNPLLTKLDCCFFLESLSGAKAAACSVENMPLCKSDTKKCTRAHKTNLNGNALHLKLTNKLRYQ